MSGGAPRLMGISRLPGGERVTLRPVCPRDSDGVQAYVRGLSPSSRYDRFLGPLNELSPAELDRVTHGDGRHLSLIAEAKVDGARVMIGEARGAVASDRLSCEIALSVADAWRGHGLGALLLAQLERRARDLGARTLVGDVLRTNAPMKRLARSAGFDMTGVPADARLVRIVKDISAPQLGVPCAPAATSRLSIAA
jgi:GNAT superfamily N-acetyltransferase